MVIMVVCCNVSLNWYSKHYLIVISIERYGYSWHLLCLMIDFALRSITTAFTYYLVVVKIPEYLAFLGVYSKSPGSLSQTLGLFSVAGYSLWKCRAIVLLGDRHF